MALNALRGLRLKKLPITVDILHRFLDVLNLHDSFDCTFWAACLVAFFGMLRKGSLFQGTLHIVIFQELVTVWSNHGVSSSSLIILKLFNLRSAEHLSPSPGTKIQSCAPVRPCLDQIINWPFLLPLKITFLPLEWMAY